MQNNEKKDLRKDLEIFSDILEGEKQHKFSFNIFKTFTLNNYFNYLLKDSTKISEAKLKLAIDLKALSKSYSYKSYLYGINILYFLLLLDSKKHIISFRMALILVCTTAFTSLNIYRYHNNYIYPVMNKIFKDDVLFLSRKLSAEEQGLDTKVKSFIIINIVVK